MSGSDSNSYPTYQMGTASKIYLTSIGLGAITGGVIAVGGSYLGSTSAGGAAVEGYELLEFAIGGHELLAPAFWGVSVGSGAGVLVGVGAVTLYEMSKLPAPQMYGAPIGPNGSAVMFSPF
jgi:hypothetical protein